MYFAYVGTIMRSSVMQLFSSSQDNAADTYTSLFLFLFLWRPLCEKWDQSSAAEKLDNIGVQKVILLPPLQSVLWKNSDFDTNFSQSCNVLKKAAAAAQKTVDAGCVYGVKFTIFKKK